MKLSFHRPAKRKSPLLKGFSQAIHTEEGNSNGNISRLAHDGISSEISRLRDSQVMKYLRKCVNFSSESSGILINFSRIFIDAERVNSSRIPLIEFNFIYYIKFNTCVWGLFVLSKAQKGKARKRFK